MAVKKSQDAKFQLHLWSRLLEARIALQKVVVAERNLEKVNSAGGNRQELEDSTVKSVSKLLVNLVRLRDTYRAKSQFCLPDQEEPEAADDEENLQIRVDDQVLARKHDDFEGLRNEVIEKWCEKTKISDIPKKGYTALELPTLQLINNALKDKERLIRRTQLDRTSHLDDSYAPETFNDDDFYHQLLKEVISKEEGRKWVELQRLRYKAKKKADTKATKGRKIKKDLIPKLVNFMAPYRPANERGREPVPEQIRNELVRSLFGSHTARAIHSD